MRALLLTFLIGAALVFSGCADETPQETEPEPTEAPAPAPTPEDIDVHEDAELVQGYGPNEWTFEIERGGKGAVRAELVSMFPDAPTFAGSYCLHYEIDLAWDNGSSYEAGSQCSAAGLSLSVGSGPVELLSESIQPDVSGSIYLYFSAEPQPMRFLLDADVDYA